MVARRAEALRPFLGATGQERLTRLYRLLRSERRAAQNGTAYDATRHAALRRLLTEAQESSGNTGVPKTDGLPLPGRPSQARQENVSDQ